MLPHERASIVLIYDMYLRDLMYGERFASTTVTLTTQEDVYPHKEQTFEIEIAKFSEIRVRSRDNYRSAWIDTPKSAHEYVLHIEPNENNTFTLERLDSKTSALAQKGSTRYYMRNVGSRYSRRVEIDDADDRGKTYTYQIEIRNDTTLGKRPF